MREKKLPMRRCVGCMESYPKDTLIRIVYYEDQLKIDRNGREKGRGVYLCRNEECVEKARKGRAFNRSYKMNFDKTVTDALLDEVKGIIEEGVNGKKGI